MKLFELEETFKNNVFKNEDDIKLHFYSDIVNPLLKEQILQEKRIEINIR